MWYFMFLVAFYGPSLTQSSKSYVDFEHANLTYWNPKYYAYINFTAQRKNRRDPIHYVSAHSESLLDVGNEISVDVYIYELMSNEFRRGFFEIHYKLCDWMRLEKTLLPVVLKFLPVKTCPFPKVTPVANILLGEYHFVDMSLPDMPLIRTLPFNKGRLFVNVSNWQSKERVLEIYIDVFVKEKM